jgi:flagellar protein FliO/FliZ
MSALGWYFLKLLILLPMVGGMAYGALWLWRKYQPGILGSQNSRAVKLIDALPMGNFGKLAVVEFEGKRLLLSVTRSKIEKVAESDISDSQS